MKETKRELTFEEMYPTITQYCQGRSCDACLVDDQCTACMGRFKDHLDKCKEAYEILTSGTVKEETKETKEPNDLINHPSHYNHGMESIDEMILIFGREVVMNFCLCNVWKYRKRAMYKNGEEDMKKSDWYMNKYKELKERVMVNGTC